MRLRQTRPIVGLAGALLLPVVMVLAGCTSNTLDNPESVTPVPSATSTSQVCTELDAVMTDIDTLQSTDLSLDNVSTLKATAKNLATSVDDLADAGSEAANAAVLNLQTAAGSLKDSVSGLGDTTTVSDVELALRDIVAAFDATEVATDCP